MASAVTYPSGHSQLAPQMARHMTACERLRIFVVDDNVCVADTVSLVLREAGFHVTTFYDAIPAVQHALQFPPDAVITDYSMPNMNGLVFAAWLQEHCPDCKIVILTGDAALVAETADGDLKFTLLQKPAHPDSLIAAVLNNTDRDLRED